MRIDVSGVCGGKTTRAIKHMLAAKANGNSVAVVVISYAEKSRLLEAYRDQGLEDVDIIVPDRVVANTPQLLGRHRMTLYIDNADMLLRNLFSPHMVRWASFTKEEIRWPTWEPEVINAEPIMIEKPPKDSM